MSHHIIEVETKTFIRFWLVMLGFVLAIFFVIKASVALIMTIIAALLAIAIRPFALKVTRIFTKNDKSKVVAIFAYLFILLVIAAIIAVVGPVIVREVVRFVSNLPNMIGGEGLEALNDLGKLFGFSDLSTAVSSWVTNFSKNFLSSYGSSVISGLGSIGSIVVEVVVTLIMSLFFLIEGPDLLHDIWKKTGAKASVSEAKDRDTKIASEVRYIISRMAWVISTFVDKKILVAIINGCSTAIFIFILSTVFHFENNLALPMGMIAMVCCIIPMFGQFIGGITITILLLFNNPIAALLWVAFYSVYSVIESNIFEPKIQGDALNLPPLIVLIAITIGTYMMGFFGTLIAIPIAGCVKVIIDELPRIREISK